MGAGNKHAWEVALQGLQRFFDEGMTRWSKERFNLLFPSEEIAGSGYVLAQLSRLEQRQFIAFVGAEELYIEVIKNQ
ncbi:hypothetical protein [Pseudomonas sp. NA-150]|uniref:hypothetical protein n=1 Tax=Pseudomonas sp. NA-150 TaxID=3367525 RepID=UPI0037C581ED